MSDGQVISGSGNWTYQYEPTLLQFNQSDNMANGHGLCKDTAGNIYFTFQAKSIKDASQVLVRFSPDGTKSVMLGKAGSTGLAPGTPHGLRIFYENGVGYLYHANNNHVVLKTTLDGEIVWKSDMAQEWKHNATFWPYKPTDAAVVPNSDVLLVEDGYGRSFVHKFNKTNGKYLGESFGGQGDSHTDPIKLHTPHGINNVPKNPNLFILCDRSNHRLLHLDADGKYKGEIQTTFPIGMSLPCNVDFMATDANENYVIAVPSLGTSPHGLGNGSVAIYNYTNLIPAMDENIDGSAVAQPLSVIEVAKHLGTLGHQHPHDAIFLPNGDLVICCWSGPADYGPAKGTISYWRRLPPQ